MILIGDHHMEAHFSFLEHIVPNLQRSTPQARNIAPFFSARKKQVIESSAANVSHCHCVFTTFSLKKKIDAENSDFDIDLGIWKVTFFGGNY